MNTPDSQFTVLHTYFEVFLYTKLDIIRLKKKGEKFSKVNIYTNYIDKHTHGNFTFSPTVILLPKYVRLHHFHLMY